MIYNLDMVTTENLFWQSSGLNPSNNEKKANKNWFKFYT